MHPDRNQALHAFFNPDQMNTPVNTEHAPQGVAHVLTANRSFSNECQGRGAVACVAVDGIVAGYFDTEVEAQRYADKLNAASK